MIAAVMALLACVHSKPDSGRPDAGADSATAVDSAAGGDADSPIGTADSADSADSVSSLDSVDSVDSADSAPPPAPMSTVEVQNTYGVVALASDGAAEGWWVNDNGIDWSTGWEDVFKASDFAICGTHAGVAVCGDQPGGDGLWTAITPPP